MKGKDQGVCMTEGAESAKKKAGHMLEKKTEFRHLGRNGNGVPRGSM